MHSLRMLHLMKQDTDRANSKNFAVRQRTSCVRQGDLHIFLVWTYTTQRWVN